MYWAIGVLVLSGVTDFLDGKIARRFHQISEVGKLLDPVADKLTQVTVLLCLAIRTARLWPLFIVCLLKELLQLIGGWLMLRRGAKVQGAKWYGKVSTFVFYFVMALFAAFPLSPEKPLLFDWNMPVWLFGILVFIVTLLLLFAFYKYALLFLELLEKDKEKAKKNGEQSEVSDE